MRRTLHRLSQALRVLYPLRSAAIGRQLVDQLGAGLEAGGAFGPQLRDALPAVVSASVEVAAAKFDSGAVALFIADLRHALRRRLEKAALAAGHREGWGTFSKARLLDVADALGTETVEQHLINAVLGVAGLYAEAMTLDVTRLDREALARAVTTMLQQSLSTILTRRELALTLERMGPQPTPTPPPASHGLGSAA